MEKRYIILANCSVGFEIPRQLIEINGEPLIKRTIRLLKENGIKDIIISSNNDKFDGLGVERHSPLYNDYNQVDPKSHWLKAFPIELMDEPVVYLFGDVYYSESAIKTIIKEDNNDILFFCTYNNKSPFYIKEHDEPLAFKVHDFDKFKKHINRLIEMWNNNETIRRPITWELYRSINGLDVNVHKMTGNYIAINDESCDIDTIDDIKNLKRKLGGIEMIKVEALQDFTLARFDEIENIERTRRSEEGKLFTGDKFECEKELCDYLLGANPLGKAVVKVIEVIPEKVEVKIEEPNVEKIAEKIQEIAKPKTTKKKNTKKSSKK